MVQAEAEGKLNQNCVDFSEVDLVSERHKKEEQNNDVEENEDQFSIALVHDPLTVQFLFVFSVGLVCKVFFTHLRRGKIVEIIWP